MAAPRSAMNTKIQSILTQHMKTIKTNKHNTVSLLYPSEKKEVKIANLPKNKAEILKQKSW